MKTSKRVLCLVLSVIMALGLLGAFPITGFVQTSASAANEHYITTWHTSMLDMNGEQASTALSLVKANPSTSTFRSTIQLGVGGREFKVTLTNYYGSTDLHVKHMSVAEPSGSGNTTTIKKDTIAWANGGNDFTIPKGGSVTVPFTTTHEMKNGDKLTFSTCLTNFNEARDTGLTGGDSYIFYGDKTEMDSSLGLAHLQKEDEAVGNYDLVPLVSSVSVKTADAGAYTTVVIGGDRKSGG